ncbi:hypothetical protein GEMRC1_004818 [Eukaryota sp. GEM-RC1]
MAGPVRKKWSKGRVRDKVNNNIFLTNELRSKLMKEIPTRKVITPFTVSESLKVTATVAKNVLKQLAAEGSIKAVSIHSTLPIYTRSVEETA